MTIQRNFLAQFVVLLGMVAVVTAANASQEAASLVGKWECDSLTYVDAVDAKGAPLVGWQKHREIISIEEVMINGKSTLVHGWCDLDLFDTTGDCKVDGPNQQFELQAAASKKTGFDGMCIKEKSASNRGKCWYGYEWDQLSDEKGTRLHRVANPLGQKLVHYGTYRRGSGTIRYAFPAREEAGVCVRVTGVDSIVGEEV